MKNYYMNPREKIGPLDIDLFPVKYDPVVIQKIIDERRRKDQGNHLPLEKPAGFPYEPPEQTPEKRDRVVIIPPEEEKQNHKGFRIIKM